MYHHYPFFVSFIILDSWTIVSFSVWLSLSSIPKLEWSIPHVSSSFYEFYEHYHYLFPHVSWSFSEFSEHYHSYAIKSARDEGYDVVLVDTAGRMQDNEPLMRALTKVRIYMQKHLNLSNFPTVDCHQQSWSHFVCWRGSCWQWGCWSTRQVQ